MEMLAPYSDPCIYDLKDWLRSGKFGQLLRVAEANGVSSITVFLGNIPAAAFETEDVKELISETAISAETRLEIRIHTRGREIEMQSGYENGPIIWVNFYPYEYCVMHVIALYEKKLVLT